MGNSGGSEAIVARARTSAAVGVPAGLDAIRATRETRRVQTIFARLRNFIFSKQKHQKRARNGEVGIWFFFFFLHVKKRRVSEDVRGGWRVWCEELCIYV